MYRKCSNDYGRMVIFIFNYYMLLSIAILFIITALGSLVMMIVKRKILFKPFLVMVGGFVMGGIILWITIPSFMYIVKKDFEVVKGQCTIEFNLV